MGGQATLHRADRPSGRRREGAHSLLIKTAMYRNAPSSPPSALRYGKIYGYSKRVIHLGLSVKQSNKEAETWSTVNKRLERQSVPDERGGKWH